MRLAEFIRQNMEKILVEWEAFAATLLPAAESMTPLALRNHAKYILDAVARTSPRLRLVRSSRRNPRAGPPRCLMRRRRRRRRMPS